jgi:DNA-binding NarL/FixJ family response regulator
VLTAGSGEQALDVYREEGAEIDLVILDLGMPGMGGLRCLDELLGIEPSARVVVASGYAADRHVEEAVSAGARRFIPKPYRLSVLCETVQEVLDQE